MDNNITIYIVFAALIIFAIIQTFRISIPKRIMMVNRNKGAEGEDRAYKKLKKMGFKFDTQYEFDATIIVDGEIKTFKLRPDIVGSKNGENWVIDVKTGNSASITKSDTRRQLREYSSYFPGYKVGLFNGDKDKLTLREIEFGDIKRNFTMGKSIKIFYFILGLLTGGYSFYLVTKFLI